MILWAVLILVVHGNLLSCVNTSQNKSVKLVEKIRRQLMENNYDYFPSEEEVFPHIHRDDVPNDPLYNDNDTQAESIDRQERRDSFVPRAKTSEEDSRANDHAISKKDLLYYMDDERLRRAGNNDVEVDKDFDDANDTDSKVKYKVIKIKSMDPNRRSLSYRRFIQEQNAEGVAIISLDGEPLPQFQLPRARRQYMLDASELDEGENGTGGDYLLR